MNRLDPKLHKLCEAFYAVGRAQFKSDKTLKSYWHWTKSFIRFHKFRPVEGMGNAEICAFLTDLASTRVTFNTQAQAMHSLLWLYKSVLKQGPSQTIAPRR